MTGADAVASLGMYDMPELQPANDCLWQRIAEALRAAGMGGVPPALCRDRPLAEIWRDPRLLLAQACGAPYVTGLRGRVRLVGVPTYDAPGCGPGTYSSAIVVARRSALARPEDLVGRRVAVNDLGSHSGAVAFRAWLAPLAAQGGDTVVSGVALTGSHRESLRAVARGDAAAAAIDAATLALLGDVAAGEVAGVRVIGWTGMAPALPYITAAGRPGREVDIVRRALAEAVSDPQLAEVCRSLRLAGIAPAREEDYGRIERMMATGGRLGSWDGISTPAPASGGQVSGS
ncbi:MAG: PhnD/SsuA/transferrin family substrate-binding protein [Rhodospirillaceae bacterium]|nr:PhnD/SsuA/transferrin family substrate-binding protein [Rhodospirillaceae bacterium]